MAQFRQSGGNGSRNGVVPDHISLSVRGGSRQFHHRRSKAPPPYKISIGFCVLILCLILLISAFFYFVLQSRGVETNGHQTQDEDNDTDFLMDVTRIQKPRELKFGHGSVSHGRDSRYWDKDDRRRDEDYTEEEQERAQDGSVDKVHTTVKNRDKISSKHDSLDHHRNGLYNEAGRNELKMYEAEYEASLKSTEKSTDSDDHKNQQSEDTDDREHRALDDVDEYDDGIDLQDDQTEESDDAGNDDTDHSSATKPHTISIEEASLEHHTIKKKQPIDEEVDEASADLYGKESLADSQRAKAISISERASSKMVMIRDEDGHQLLSDLYLANVFIGLLMASFDTTSSTITAVINYLAQLPHIYDEVFKELMAIARSKGPDEMLTWEDIEKMKYSGNVLRESMRLMPPAQGTFRETNTEFTYEGFTIPKGWKTFWTVHSTHKNPAYFSEPEKFDPSRYEGSGPAPYTYVPFGGGPKMCPGREYAKLEILVFMYNVVTRFKLEKTIPNEKIVFYASPAPVHGLPIRLHPHQN